eukprot:9212472-Alexandrium_andersonii.AAC.1
MSVSAASSSAACTTTSWAFRGAERTPHVPRRAFSFHRTDSCGEHKRAVGVLGGIWRPPSLGQHRQDTWRPPGAVGAKFKSVARQ